MQVALGRHRHHVKSTCVQRNHFNNIFNDNNVSLDLPLQFYIHALSIYFIFHKYHELSSCRLPMLNGWS
jgi:hypothetical protein